jgi:F-type H+-transporting ATPase subunit a
MLVSKYSIKHLLLLAFLAFFSANCFAQQAPVEDTTIPENVQTGVNQVEATQHEDGVAHTQVEAGLETHGAHGDESSMPDIKSILFEHVGDAHNVHIFSIGSGHHATHVSLPLPIILYDNQKGLSVFSSSKFGHTNEETHESEVHDGYKIGRTESKIKEVIMREDGSTEGLYDFSITKNVFSMFISIAILFAIMFAVAKRSKRNGVNKAPTGIQNAIEPLVVFIRDNVAKPFLGAKHAKYMPLLLTMFFFVWINNLLGLLPFGFNLTGNIAFTAMLALVYFIVMLFSTTKYFWGHIFNPPGVPGFVKAILVPIEVLGIFIKPVALCLRLFANIFAGHTIILCVLCLIFIFKALFGPAVGWASTLISVPFTIFMFFLELLVAAIQAFIFTNLTAVFVGQAMEEHHHETHDVDHAENLTIS